MEAAQIQVKKDRRDFISIIERIPRHKLALRLEDKITCRKSGRVALRVAAFHWILSQNGSSQADLTIRQWSEAGSAGYDCGRAVAYATK